MLLSTEKEYQPGGYRNKIVREININTDISAIILTLVPYC